MAKKTTPQTQSVEVPVVPAAEKKSSKASKKQPEAVPEPEPVIETDEETVETVNGMAPWAVVKETQNQLAEKLQISQKDLKLICDTFMNAVILKVQDEGESVCFRGNFTLKRVLRKERTHRNPKTGAEIIKPAHYAMALEMKPALKEAFNNIDVVEESNVESEADDE